MSNLTKANEARKKNALNKPWRFEEHGIKSFKELIDQGVFSRAEQKQVYKYMYSRTKYNRMNQDEQDIYEEKLKEKKQGYFLYHKSDESVCSEVSRFVYEYFLETQNKEICANCDDKIAHNCVRYSDSNKPYCEECLPHGENTA